MGTKPNFSSVFRLQTDGQYTGTNIILEDLLGTYGLWKKFDDYSSVVEFSYNNRYQFSFGMTPYEAPYGRRCRTPIFWDEIGVRKMLDRELVEKSV